jgi:hypothetical protein
MAAARRRATGAWIAFGACVALTVADLVTALSVRTTDENASWAGGGYLFNALFVISLLSFPAVGLLIAIKGHDGVISRLLLTIGLCWGVADLTAYPDVGIHARPGNLLADLMAALSSCAWLPAIGLTGTFLILLFPDGKLPGPRWRWVGWTSAVSIALGITAILFTPGKLDQTGYPNTDNPLGIEALGGVFDAMRLMILLVPMMMVASAVSLVVRYRRSHGLERQQLKWLAAAAAVVAVTYLVVQPLSVLLDPNRAHAPEWLLVAQEIALISFALIPAAIGAAILRYRLYEIDVIIRRTLVYAVLVATLALVYLGGVTAIGWVLRDVAGQSSALAVTISTLAVAVAFQPLRRRIQRGVDRRFYRRTYDAQAAVSGFSTRLREQVDLDAIAADLVRTTESTMSPRTVSVWLRSDTR